MAYTLFYNAFIILRYPKSRLLNIDTVSVVKIHSKTEWAVSPVTTHPVYDNYTQALSSINNNGHGIIQLIKVSLSTFSRHSL